MDFSSLKDQVSNLTLYDLKAGFRKAQNGTRRNEPASWPLLTCRCSRHELYRDGGQGPRGDQQRAVGYVEPGMMHEAVTDCSQVHPRL